MLIRDRQGNMQSMEYNILFSEDNWAKGKIQLSYKLITKNGHSTQQLMAFANELRIK